MKNASQIISSIQKKPQFRKLSTYGCIKKLQSTFVPAMQKMIKFGYIKNGILYFVLNHPAAKQEFDNNIQSIKSALKFVKPKECEDSGITDIKAFVTHTPTKNEEENFQHCTVVYKERAVGDFSIDIKDEKLNKLVHSIQKIIKDKNDTKRNN